MEPGTTADGRSARKPTGPRGLPLLGNALQMGGSDSLVYMRKIFDRYGDLVFLRAGPLPCFALRHPDHIHQVLVKNQSLYIKGMGYDGLRLLMGRGLVTSEGDLWRQQRKLMQPSFTPKAITGFFAMMVEVTEALLDRWEPLAARDEAVVMDDEMVRLTMSVIGRAMFSVDLGAERDELGDAFREAFAFIPQRSMSPLHLPLAFPLPSHRRFRRAMGLINAFIGRKIEEARRRGDEADLISMLLRARDPETQQPMSEAQLRDEAITLFFAGFETTARSLAWAFYLLARHPAVARRLAAEVDRCLGGRPPQLDDLMRLSFTRQIVDETMRLYPPTALLARQADQPDNLAGYPIPKGALMLLVPYLAHRHPDLWPDPEQFDPDRFRPELVAVRPKQAYIPFASGPRVCIGNNFALLEMTLALAMAAGRFRFSRPGGGRIGVRFVGTTRPDSPIVIKLHKRRD